MNKTRIITVTSGKGGVGKTNLSVNMGIALAQLGNKVTILDADLGLANVNVFLGMVPKFNLYHVIKGQKSLAEVMVQTPFGLKMIAGASGFHQIANLNTADRERFVQNLQLLESEDYVIIDTGAGVSDNVLRFILCADTTIVITTPEPTSITDAYGIIKAISSQTKEKLSMKLVINRVHSASQAEEVLSRIQGIAKRFLNMNIDPLGYICEDAAIHKAVMQQQPLLALYPNAKASRNIEQITRSIAGLPISAERGGFFRLIRSFFMEG